MFFFCFSFLYHLIDITSFLLSLSLFTYLFLFTFFFITHWFGFRLTRFLHKHSQIFSFFFCRINGTKQRNFLTLSHSQTTRSHNFFLHISQLNYLVLFKLAHLAILFMLFFSVYFKPIFFTLASFSLYWHSVSRNCPIVCFFVFCFQHHFFL